MPAELWAALIPAGVLGLTVYFAVRLTLSPTADPKFEFLNSLLKTLEERPGIGRRHAA